MGPRLELYGVEIAYPFEERSVLRAVRSEIRMKKELKAQGLSDSRVLEELQLAAKGFYTTLQKFYGREKVNEFIRMFTIVQIKYLESLENHRPVIHFNYTWLYAALLMVFTGSTLAMSLNIQ